jgi:hypothetical protein
MMTASMGEEVQVTGARIGNPGHVNLCVALTLKSTDSHVYVHAYKANMNSTRNYVDSCSPRLTSSFDYTVYEGGVVLERNTLICGRVLTDTCRTTVSQNTGESSNPRYVLKAVRASTWIPESRRPGSVHLTRT